METPPPPPPATVPGTVTATVKTPDPETETPTRIQSNSTPKQLPPPLTNGVLKRHRPIHHHAPPPPPVVVTYKECLKNHAATMGGQAVDGCGEFMPSPTSSPTYPTSLKCAACGCHRNFHRREPDESLQYLNTQPIQHVIEYQPHHRHHPPPPAPSAPQLAGSPGNSPSPPPISSSYYPSAPHMLLALSTGVSAPPAENNHHNHHPTVPTTPGSGAGGSGLNPNGKKRFRTKFTPDQKEKMHEIAERVGWKMQKRDEELIVGFCNQIGVDKGVFKVWMHNNKTTFSGNKNNGFSGEGIDFINITRNNHHNDDVNHHDGAGNNHHDGGNNHLHLHNNDSFSTGGNVICTNGSSSSS